VIRFWLFVAFVLMCILGTANVWALLFGRGWSINVIGAVCCFISAFWFLSLWLEH
jgi:hypothetical protein